MLEFQQSETTAERRRIMLHLVDATDGITPETGITGQGWITKNGAAAVQTTNSLVEVDATNMPGFYYIELTQGELDTLGFLGFRFKTAATAEFQDRALVSYNDPYVMAGGFSGGSGESFKLTKAHIKSIAEAVWSYLIGEKPAAQVLTDAATHPVMDMDPMMKKIDGIKMPKLDLTPVLKKISEIEPPKDYTQMFADLTKAVNSLEQANVEELSGAVSKFTAKMNTVVKEITTALEGMNAATQGVAGSLDSVNEIKSTVSNLQFAMDQLFNKATEMSDMDKRFSDLTSNLHKEEIKNLAQKVDSAVKQLLMALADSKYQIISELTK